LPRRRVGDEDGLAAPPLLGLRVLRLLRDDAREVGVRLADVVLGTVVRGEDDLAAPEVDERATLPFEDEHARAPAGPQLLEESGQREQARLPGEERGLALSRRVGRRSRP